MKNIIACLCHSISVTLLFSHLELHTVHTKIPLNITGITETITFPNTSQDFASNLRDIKGPIWKLFIQNNSSPWVSTDLFQGLSPMAN